MSRVAVPLFSVIVPTYNNEKEIQKCIDSILGQSYTDFELILLDDGSTDKTPLICDRYAKQDRRVRVFHKQNKGVVAARNDGLFYAIGKYVYYVDADDWIEHSLLQEAAIILDGLNPTDIFAFGYELITEKGQKVSCPCFLKAGLYQKERLISEVYPSMMNPYERRHWRPVVSYFIWDKIILRSLLMKHYCQDTSLFMSEDIACTYECLYFAEQVYFSEKILYFYNRQSESSTNFRYHENLLENNRRMIQYLRIHLGNKGDDAIRHQINRIEYQKLLDFIWQELKFCPSVWKSSRHIKTKMHQIRAFPVCTMQGLSLYEKCVVLFLSFRFLYLFMLILKIIHWQDFSSNKCKHDHKDNN